MSFFVVVIFSVFLFVCLTSLEGAVVQGTMSHYCVESHVLVFKAYYRTKVELVPICGKRWNQCSVWIDDCLPQLYFWLLNIIWLKRRLFSRQSDYYGWIKCCKIGVLSALKVHWKCLVNYFCVGTIQSKMNYNV